MEPRRTRKKAELGIYRKSPDLVFGAIFQFMRSWEELVLLEYISNMLGDSLEMAHSVEGRVPFLG